MRTRPSFMAATASVGVLLAVAVAQWDAGSRLPREALTPEPQPGEVIETPTAGRERRFPAASIPPPGRRCPEGWSYFDNPVYAYWFCYPPRWGFWEASPQVAGLVAVTELYVSDLHLVGPDAFPYEDEEPAGYPIQSGALHIEFLRFESSGNIDHCRPEKEISLSSTSGRWCEFRYDSWDLSTGQNSDGRFRGIALLVPLVQRVGQADSLLVFVSAQAPLSEYPKGIAWDVLRTIHPYTPVSLSL